MATRILILDLHSVLHAVKFSLGKHRLSNNEKPTFVIYGFLLKLQLLIRKTRASVIVFALDSNTSKRKELYPEYKENRDKDKTPEMEELDRLALPQFEKVRNYVIPIMGYRNIFHAQGLEADDIIGRVCKTYKDYEIVVCTTDRDIYQLLSRNICIFDAKKNTWYTHIDFQNEYGIEPHIWKRVKAIGGCKSDNVKGVPIPQTDPTKKQMHVAEKTALNFIKGELGENTKAYKAIVSNAGKRVINRNKSLVILPRKDTPEYRIERDIVKESGFVKICNEFGFQSILKDLTNWKRVLGIR